MRRFLLVLLVGLGLVATPASAADVYVDPCPQVFVAISPVGPIYPGTVGDFAVTSAGVLVKSVVVDGVGSAQLDSTPTSQTIRAATPADLGPATMRFTWTGDTSTVVCSGTVEVPVTIEPFPACPQAYGTIRAPVWVVVGEEATVITKPASNMRVTSTYATGEDGLTARIAEASDQHSTGQVSAPWVPTTVGTTTFRFEYETVDWRTDVPRCRGVATAATSVFPSGTKLGDGTRPRLTGTYDVTFRPKRRGTVPIGPTTLTFRPGCDVGFCGGKAVFGGRPSTFRTRGRRVYVERRYPFGTCRMRNGKRLRNAFAEKAQLSLAVEPTADLNNLTGELRLIAFVTVDAANKCRLRRTTVSRRYVATLARQPD